MGRPTDSPTLLARPMASRVLRLRFPNPQTASLICPACGETPTEGISRMLLRTASSSFPALGCGPVQRPQDNFSKDRPSGRCLPHGIPDAMLVPATPFKIVQTPGVTLILYENQGHFRQVFTDGRGFPKENASLLAWLFHREGGRGHFHHRPRGLNDQTYLDDGGHPHSDAYHAVERFRRRDFGHLGHPIHGR